jgi:segregation and condensation protein B
MSEKKSLQSSIESLLFVFGEPIKLAKIAKICEVAKEDVIREIEALNADYKTGGNGFSVIQKDDLVQLATNPENSEIVSRLVSGELQSDLSRSALEVLAIIAYRGPITRVQIDTIRGVNCSYVLRGLMVKGLVERKETADIRGYLYEISFDFLKSLGIASVQDLPDWENLSKNEKIEELLIESEQAAAIDQSTDAIVSSEVKEQS